MAIQPRIPDSPMLVPFAEYITLNRAIIKQRRMDLQQGNANLIIDANSPWEFFPEAPIPSGQRLKYGVLLIHGLLDCPFSLKDLGNHLQGNGILCLSILLPGHGTRPEDLLSVSFQDWIRNVRYGIDSLRDKVDHLYLAGYSTGAALSLHEAFQGSQFAGIILLAPAIRIKIPMNLVIAWRYLKKWLHINHNQWIDKVTEPDYTKYHSTCFNAVHQVNLLTDAVKQLREEKPLSCPMFMAVSREDETISSQKAIAFFSDYHHPESKLLLYASTPDKHADKRIITRITRDAALNIKHFSHVSLPYSPLNPHYGQHGDYVYASHPDDTCIYGAYSRAEANYYERLYQAGLLKHRYRQLTYNPDFDYMAEAVTKFIVEKQ